MTGSTVPATPMLHALALAERAIGLSDPNPRVGCLIVGRDGTPLGEGHTQAAGDAHAEVMALRDAAARGRDVRGATVFVTLEPCSHHGRTPPCSDALAASGVGKVVIAVADPNPLVCGRGAARLQAAGIEIAWGTAADADAARELNIGFFSRMTRGRPWVRMKVAASFDGRTALPDGQSQWLTGEAARIDGHRWRRRAGAVLTGVGTVLADDPRLDVRHVEVGRQPLRAVVDSTLATPPTARILSSPGDVLIYACDAEPAREAALTAAGGIVVRRPGQGGRVDLHAVVGDLARRGVNELHVEAGERLNASFAEAGLVDEWLVYLAPKLLGAGRGMAALGPLRSLADALELSFVGIERVGADLRIVARGAAAEAPTPSRSEARS